MIIYPPLRRGIRRLVLGSLLGVASVLAPARFAAAQPTLPPPQPVPGDVLLHAPVPLAPPGPGPGPGCLPPPTETGFPPELPLVSPQAPRDVFSFVDSLGGNDAMFEVTVGQGRLLTLKENFAVPGKPRPLIAVGDPATVEFAVVGPRQIRVIGQRIGVTDLSITASDNKTYTFKVNVVADLDVLRCHLKTLFPDAYLKLRQLRDHIVVEGEARDTQQVAQILETIRAYLASLQASEARRVSGQSAAPGAPRGVPRAAPEGAPAPAPGQGSAPPGANVTPEAGNLSVEGTIVEARIINLIRVPGPQQVLLKVRVGELSRTALREIGSDILGVDTKTGAILGTQIGGNAVSALATLTGSGIRGFATGGTSPTTTAFGIFEAGNFEVLLRALRRNTVLKILAEPNLVAMNGHQASFLSGGEFPVPVAQTGGGGAAPTITVQFREFGVRLGFVPFILDNDEIRLTVDPEVSTVDPALGTTLVPGGSPVPGLDTRKAHATVQMREGQTLMIGGLLQLDQNGRTDRIPFLGDLPVIGPFFSSTTMARDERELVILVTPYLVHPMEAGQVPHTPGDEVYEPNDLEFYLFNRIEGRTRQDFRSTTKWDLPVYVDLQEKLEDQRIYGPHGYSH